MDENEKLNEEQARADENNANVVSNAADVAIASGNPYAMAAGAIIKAGDATTDGHMSRTLGKATTVVNKGLSANNDGGTLQKGLNQLSESGTADKIGTAASIYSMGKGGAGGASKAAEGAGKAAGAANEASKAAEAVNSAKAAENAAKATGDATKVEEAKNATKAAEKTSKEANKNVEEIQKRNEVAQKTQNNTKIAKTSTQKTNPYDEVKKREDRNLQEIVEDKKVESENKNTDNIKMGGEQLDKALDVVDVALDVVDSAQSKSKKIIIFIILFPVLVVVIGVLFIVMSVASMFGADISPGGTGYTSIEETISEDFTYKYNDTLSINISEEELVKGLVYYNLYNDIETYKNDNINMEVLYEVYGAIYTLNIINTSKDSNTITYDDYIYCSSNGCYNVLIDGKEYYVDEEVSKYYTVSNTISSIKEEYKEEFDEYVSEGFLVGTLLKDNNTKTKTVDDDLKNKILGYVKDGKNYEEILEKLGYNTKLDELEDIDLE